MPYTSISISDKILYIRNIKVAENMEIEITYRDKYYNYGYEVYKITLTPSGIKRELIGDEIYWTSYNNKNKNDTFLVLKDGVIVKEEEKEEKEDEEDIEEKEEKEDVEHVEDEEDIEDVEYEEDIEDIEDEEYYNFDGNETMSSSSIEDESINPNVKRTTGFLVFASENKNDKTNLDIIYLGPINTSILDINKMTELGKMWTNLSKNQQAYYNKKARNINRNNNTFVEVEL